MSYKDTDNSADTLDIRYLIERIEELREERENFEPAEDGLLAGAPWADAETDEAAELAALESFVEEMKSYGGDHQWEGDWYPVTLIRDSYWTDYVQDYADDIHGEGMRDAQWPMNCIDWEKAGRELQMDYSSAEYDGVTYWYR